MRSLPPALKKGNIFRMTEDSPERYEVVRVTASGAHVKHLGAKHNVIRDPDGNVIAEFNSSSESFVISSYSQVFVEESNADKK